MIVTRPNWKKTASRLVMAGTLAAATGGPALAQTMDAALARAYSANPTLNAQRAAVRATNENVPQALSGYRPRITASADIGASITESDIQPTRAEVISVSARNGRVSRRGATPAAFITISSESLLSLLSV